MTFTSVKYNDLGRIPARVNRHTGELELNRRTWPTMPENYKEYILLHEKGHITLNTSDETIVNQFAVLEYLKPYRNNPAQLSRRIAELAEITNPAKTKAFDNFGIYAFISTFLGWAKNDMANRAASLASTNADMQTVVDKSYENLNKEKNKIYIISGAAFLVVLIITYKIWK